jgi:transitional endoplasmic reticulum ATPase
MPDAKGRESIFRIHTKKKPIADNVDYAKLVEYTEGLSGADIAGVCNRAAMTAIKRYVNNKEKSVKSIKIAQEDFVNAINKIRPEKAHQISAVTS